MFRKVLVANRGEIALRIMRTLKEMGITSVAVHSDADEDSLHVKFADEAVCIGPPSSKDSYLNIPRIMSAIELTNSDAVHPGYGFLAENAGFADACESCGITFIGPSAENISNMGDKSLARELMKTAGLPLVPGSEGEIDDPDEALEIAESIGYPIMVKASAGGGGKGMRLAGSRDELVKAFMAARGEAEAAFGNAGVYLEKAVVGARHIEIQLLADKFGEIVHLGERDCSLQRRHQKLIEESPSPAVDSALREKMGKAAVEGARGIGYASAGTMEFLLARDGQFYFMEMNTRIQVEHPVTEMVTGIDLIREQIRIAAGESLGLGQESIRMHGHAIECRINAEDPSRNFAPCPGTVDEFHLPGGFGTRVDTHVYAGYKVSPYYDSMIGKLVVHGRDREDATRRIERALEEFVVGGIETTLPFHLLLVRSDAFKTGDFDTKFAESFNVNNPTNVAVPV
jgi:acetyl-CoA carboxylase biotin carboxylase subunit